MPFDVSNFQDAGNTVESKLEFSEAVVTRVESFPSTSLSIQSAKAVKFETAPTFKVEFGTGGATKFEGGLTIDGDFKLDDKVEIKKSSRIAGGLASGDVLSANRRLILQGKEDAGSFSDVLVDGRLVAWDAGGADALKIRGGPSAALRDLNFKVSALGGTVRAVSRGSDSADVEYRTGSGAQLRLDGGRGVIVSGESIFKQSINAGVEGETGHVMFKESSLHGPYVVGNRNLVLSGGSAGMAVIGDTAKATFKAVATTAGVALNPSLKLVSASGDVVMNPGGSRLAFTNTGPITKHGTHLTLQPHGIKDQGLKIDCDTSDVDAKMVLSTVATNGVSSTGGNLILSSFGTNGSDGGVFFNKYEFTSTGEIKNADQDILLKPTSSDTSLKVEKHKIVDDDHVRLSTASSVSGFSPDLYFSSSSGGVKFGSILFEAGGIKETTTAPARNLTFMPSGSSTIGVSISKTGDNDPSITTPSGDLTLQSATQNILAGTVKLGGDSSKNALTSQSATAGLILGRNGTADVGLLRVDAAADKVSITTDISRPSKILSVTSAHQDQLVYFSNETSHVISGNAVAEVGGAVVMRPSDTTDTNFLQWSVSSVDKSTHLTSAETIKLTSDAKKVDFMSAEFFLDNNGAEPILKLQTINGKELSIQATAPKIVRLQEIQVSGSTGATLQRYQTQGGTGILKLGHGSYSGKDVISENDLELQTGNLKTNPVYSYLHLDSGNKKTLFNPSTAPTDHLVIEDNTIKRLQDELKLFSGAATIIVADDTTVAGGVKLTTETKDLCVRPNTVADNSVVIGDTSTGTTHLSHVGISGQTITSQMHSDKETVYAKSASSAGLKPTVITRGSSTLYALNTTANSLSVSSADDEVYFADSKVRIKGVEINTPAASTAKLSLKSGKTNAPGLSVESKSVNNVTSLVLKPDAEVDTYLQSDNEMFVKSTSTLEMEGGTTTTLKTSDPLEITPMTTLPTKTLKVEYITDATKTGPMITTGNGDLQLDSFLKYHYLNDDLFLGQSDYTTVQQNALSGWITSQHATKKVRLEGAEIEDIKIDGQSKLTSVKKQLKLKSGLDNILAKHNVELDTGIALTSESPAAPGIPTPVDIKPLLNVTTSAIGDVTIGQESTGLVLKLGSSSSETALRVSGAGVMDLGHSTDGSAVPPPLVRIDGTTLTSSSGALSIQSNKFNTYLTSPTAFLIPKVVSGVTSTTIAVSEADGGGGKVKWMTGSSQGPLYMSGNASTDFVNFDGAGVKVTGSATYTSGVTPPDFMPWSGGDLTLKAAAVKVEGELYVTDSSNALNGVTVDNTLHVEDKVVKLAAKEINNDNNDASGLDVTSASTTYRKNVTWNKGENGGLSFWEVRNGEFYLTRVIPGSVHDPPTSNDVTVTYRIGVDNNENFNISRVESGSFTRIADFTSLHGAFTTTSKIAHTASTSSVKVTQNTFITGLNEWRMAVYKSENEQANLLSGVYPPTGTNALVNALINASVSGYVKSGTGTTNVLEVSEYITSDVGAASTTSAPIEAGASLYVVAVGFFNDGSTYVSVETISASQNPVLTDFVDATSSNAVSSEYASGVDTIVAKFNVFHLDESGQDVTADNFKVFSHSGSVRTDLALASASKTLTAHPENTLLRVLTAEIVSDKNVFHHGELVFSSQLVATSDAASPLGYALTPPQGELSGVFYDESVADTLSVTVASNDQTSMTLDLNLTSTAVNASSGTPWSSTMVENVDHTVSLTVKDKIDPSNMGAVYDKTIEVEIASGASSPTSVTFENLPQVDAKYDVTFVVTDKFGNVSGTQSFGSIQPVTDYNAPIVSGVSMFSDAGVPSVTYTVRDISAVDVFFALIDWDGVNGALVNGLIGPSTAVQAPSEIDATVSDATLAAAIANKGATFRKRLALSTGGNDTTMTDTFVPSGSGSTFNIVTGYASNDVTVVTSDPKNYNHKAVYGLLVVKDANGNLSWSARSRIDINSVYRLANDTSVPIQVIDDTNSVAVGRYQAAAGEKLRIPFFAPLDASNAARSASDVATSVAINGVAGSVYRDSGVPNSGGYAAYYAEAPVTSSSVEGPGAVSIDFFAGNSDFTLSAFSDQAAPAAAVDNTAPINVNAVTVYNSTNTEATVHFHVDLQNAALNTQGPYTSSAYEHPVIASVSITATPDQTDSGQVPITKTQTSANGYSEQSTSYAFDQLVFDGLDALTGYTFSYTVIDNVGKTISGDFAVITTEGTMTIDGNYQQIYGADDAAVTAAFEQDLQTYIGAVAGVSGSSIIIVSVSEGSFAVDYQLSAMVTPEAYSDKLEKLSVNLDPVHRTETVERMKKPAVAQVAAAFTAKTYTPTGGGAGVTAFAGKTETVSVGGQTKVLPKQIVEEVGSGGTYTKKTKLTVAEDKASTQSRSAQGSWTRTAVADLKTSDAPVVVDGKLSEASKYTTRTDAISATKTKMVLKEPPRIQYDQSLTSWPRGLAFNKPGVKASTFSKSAISVTKPSDTPASFSTIGDQSFTYSAQNDGLERTDVATVSITGSVPLANTTGGLSLPGPVSVAVTVNSSGEYLLDGNAAQHVIQGYAVTFTSVPATNPVGFSGAGASKIIYSGTTYAGKKNEIQFYSGDVTLVVKSPLSAPGATWTLDMVDFSATSQNASNNAKIASRIHAVSGKTEIMEHDEFVDVDLDDYFHTDSDWRSRTYSVTTSNSTLLTPTVEADEVAGTAVLKLAKKNRSSPANRFETGDATVTVTVTYDGYTAVITSDFTIVDNVTPTVKSTIPDVTIDNKDAMTETIDLNNPQIFQDSATDVLTYTATASDASVATVSVSGSILSITGGANGSATVTVTATDKLGAQVSDTLDLTVNVISTAKWFISNKREYLNFTSGLTSMKKEGESSFYSGNYIWQSGNTNYQTITWSEYPDSVYLYEVVSASDWTKWYASNPRYSWTSSFSPYYSFSLKIEKSTDQGASWTQILYRSGGQCSYDENWQRFYHRVNLTLSTSGGEWYRFKTQGEKNHIVYGAYGSGPVW